MSPSQIDHDRARRVDGPDGKHDGEDRYRGESSAYKRLVGRFAAPTSSWLGSKWAFSAAFLVIVLWAACGPAFHYSNTWQLVINTGTTIVTFLMVFLIQNTQNRDAKAINLKLNELIRALGNAHNQMIDIRSCIGWTTSWGSVVMTVKVSSSILAL